DDLRAMIRRVRELTNRPFGVNLWLHRALRPPVDPAEISEEVLRGAQGMLNRFRQQLGIPTTTARPTRAPDLMQATIKVVLDGRGLVAALALGASGVLLGTRFVATRESMAPELYKKRLLESESGDTTVTDTLSGLWARALANRFTREYTESGAPVLPPLVQRGAANDVFIAALKQGDADYYPMMAGQSVGLVRDLPG